MTDIIAKIARSVVNTVWTGVQDVFSSSGGTLIAIVIAIVLSIFPFWILCTAAIVLFAGIIYNQYTITLDSESK